MRKHDMATEMGNQQKPGVRIRKRKTGTHAPSGVPTPPENTENITGSAPTPPPLDAEAANTPGRAIAARYSPAQTRSGADSMPAAQEQRPSPAGLNGASGPENRSGSGTAKRGRKLTREANPTSAESANLLDKAMAAQVRRIELLIKDGREDANTLNSLTNAQRTLANYRLQRRGLDMGLDNDRLEAILRGGTSNA